VATAWGMLLGVLTYLLSRLRRVLPVVAVSRILGGWIAAHVS
jgi:hypothetical protein